MDSFRPWLRVSRPGWLLLTLNPVLLGSVYAVHDAFPFRWGTFAIAVLGAVFAHAGMSAVRETFDPSETDPASVQPARVVASAGIALALVSALALVPLTGAAILGLAFAGIMLGLLYSIPPLPLRELGGIGEVVVAAVFGPLLVLGGYYAQSSEISFGALIASLPLGLLTAAAFFGEHFVHARRGADAMCPVRSLGESQAKLLLFALPILGYLAIVMNVTQKEYPRICLASLLTAAPLGWKLLRLGSKDTVESYQDLVWTALLLDVVTGGLILVGFLLSPARDV